MRAGRSFELARQGQLRAGSDSVHAATVAVSDAWDTNGAHTAKGPHQPVIDCTALIVPPLQATPRLTPVCPRVFMEQTQTAQARLNACLKPLTQFVELSTLYVGD